MSLAAWIGLGAAGGVLTGILAGDVCKALQPIGSAYVMLLESVVYPYLISSLLHGLGRLSPKVALKLLKKSWPFYLAAWGGTLGIIYLLSLAFPSSPPPIIVDAADTARTGPDFLQLILPGNIFRDLANNYVPAVVLLSALFGVAIQGIESKDRVLDILVLIRTACVKIWRWVVLLAPVAVFAMFASTVGTLRVAEAGGLVVYLSLFLIVCGILAMVVVPVVISSLVPVRYREVIYDLRNGLTLALVTTLSVVALPYIQQAIEKLAKSTGLDDEHKSEIIETSLAVNYPLGQLGNFFVYFFILFVAFYTRTSLSTGELAALPFMTLFSCFGSPTSTVNAVDFLGAWLKLPGHPTALYVETMMITRYGQVALSVMGFAFLTYLMTFNYYGRIKIRLGRLLACVGLLVACTAGLAWGGHVLLSDVLKTPQKTYLGFTMPEDLTKGVKAKIYDSREAYLRDNPDAGLKPGETVLGRIQRTQTLRVGYGREIVPFTYRNEQGDLVGYDVACAYDLARSLNVKLVFVPVVYDKVEQDVKRGIMDVWAGGVYVVESRMLWGTFSQSYYHSPMALIVPSDRVAEFMDMDEILCRANLSIAVFENPVMRGLAKRLFPQAKQLVVPDYGQLTASKGWDVALWTLEQAGVWASGHPGYTAVRPKHMGAVMIFAYLMHKNSDRMRQLVDHWLDMRQADGFLAKQRAYWIEGAVAGGVRDR
ncbi:MAG: cation:dicarboxylase symporter family transporter [Desulfarculaceae bacterium]|nr:cation:dicarboxylase symporter family transporter [Desulfarculaceae bacterium]MCF8046641.1 cation:dicarboxylase symporter family transporter [Desulfarculaceae bacterium]MCF8065854.1 cation:dicarboxylase symporter family transporter [Desulfarculaceae bacterium]MCF8096857.1 cation:dicarboxylase symporter family transporter [Desulfarculaceae bacterium]MCF8121833.1 cation:dicarboxylase symporter family transporter [Desulfarculaceae bacterium]